MEITPINVDINARVKDYAGLKGDELRITSIFPTVQGEGPFAGRRAVFVRLSGCNFGGKGVSGPGCDFCDTDFTLGEGRVLTFDRIADEIEAIFPGKSYEGTGLGKRDAKMLVVITGGEPMLQSNLVGFIKYCMCRGLYHFQIESNGSRLLPIPSTGAYLVVSPKILRGAGAKTLTYSTPSPKVIKRADCLKFIVSADQKNPYHNLPGFAFSFRETGKPVYVSPMAIYRTAPGGEVASIWDSKVFDQKETAKNHAYAARLAMNFGFFMSVQMHLYAAIP